MKKAQQLSKPGLTKSKPKGRQPLKEITASSPITKYTTVSKHFNEPEKTPDGSDETTELSWGTLKCPKVSKKLLSPITVRSRSFAACKLRPDKDKGKEVGQTSLLTHFSARKSKRIMEAEHKKRNIDTVLHELEGDEQAGLEICELPEKGRAIFTTRPFNSGDYVCEYTGEFISITTAAQREMTYSDDVLKGCYMYYFKHRRVKYCIDATRETGRFGRLINHSRIRYNLRPRVIEGDTIHLCFFATRGLRAGEELLYDYGDRSRESLKNFPWLKT